MGDAIAWVVLAVFALVALGAVVEGASALVAATREATDRRSPQGVGFLLAAAVVVVAAVALTLWLETSTTGVGTFGDSTLGNVAEWLVLVPVLAVTLFMAGSMIVLVISAPLSIAFDRYRRHIRRIE